MNLRSRRSLRFKENQNLARHSIATPAEQLTDAVDSALARRQVPLARLAEWHIMSACRPC
jgi:hypothetical protein